MGEGLPLLVLGGGPGVSSRMYRQHFQLLARSRTLIFWDYRGTGRSKKGPPFGFQEDHHDLLEVIAQLAPEKLALLAHSYGGLHALKYAIEHPERVTDLILISATATFAQVGEAASRAKRMRLGEARMAEQAALFEALSRAPNEEAIARKISRIEAINQFLSPTPRQIDLFAEAGINYRAVMENQDWVSLDLSRQLSQIKSRTLVVLSTKDIIVAPEHSRALAQGIPDARRLEVSQSGHWCFIEEPEVFFAEMGRFLSAPSR